MARSDYQGKGYETPVEDNPKHEQDDNFTVPEKDPGRTRTKGRKFKGQTAGIGTKVREFPSHK